MFLQGIAKEFEELDTVWYLAGRWAQHSSRTIVVLPFGGCVERQGPLACDPNP